MGIALFLILAISMYGAYTGLLNAVQNSRLKISAIALANEQFEIVRNLPYSDVGIAGGLPSGKIVQNKTVSRDGANFNVKTTIRNIDDPFDGTIGGSPNDLSPADYKLVELEISCALCQNFSPLYFNTHVGPKNLESSSTNGALFVQVFDANGQPVPQADVHIENSQAGFSIDDTTNNSGLLQIIDAPPGVEAYNITVSKNEYSEEKTYPTGEPSNPNPVKPNATVAVQQVTQISFAIDRTSSINVSTVTETCSAVPGVGFSLTGSKLIGEPNVLKYPEHLFSTDSSGSKVISGLEWDAYGFLLNDSSYGLVGSSLISPVNLIPNTSQDLKFIVAPKTPNSLLVAVRDAATQLPLSGAEVLLKKTGYSNSFISGQGFYRQSDWSSGPGQEDFIDPLKYFSSDGNIEVSLPEGELKLKEAFPLGGSGDQFPPGGSGDQQASLSYPSFLYSSILNIIKNFFHQIFRAIFSFKIAPVVASSPQYASSGYLVSSTFDMGSESNFYQIFWQPKDQPPEAGQDSVKFQIATNNDKATWNFLGPDGTSNTFYTLSDANINSVHNNNRYLRYKVFLSTEDTDFTPNLGEVSFTFSSECVPPGQVIFSGLEAGTYSLSVSKSGYQTVEQNVNVSQPWQESQITLNP